MKQNFSYSGFTLIELMVASSVSLLVTLAIITVFAMVNKISFGGNRQVNYNDMARKAQGKIIQIIEDSRACSVSSPTVLILTRPTSNNLVTASLSYVDADNNRATTSNNSIIYDPDINVTGDQEIICNYVSPIDGSSAIFTTLNVSPATIGVAMHVGDATNTPGANFLNTGYQGFVLQFSATPRNLQWWYNL